MFNSLNIINKWIIIFFIIGHNFCQIWIRIILYIVIFGGVVKKITLIIFFSIINIICSWYIEISRKNGINSIYFSNNRKNLLKNFYAIFELLITLLKVIFIKSK